MSHGTTDVLYAWHVTTNGKPSPIHTADDLRQAKTELLKALADANDPHTLGVITRTNLGDPYDAFYKIPVIVDIGYAATFGLWQL